MGTLIYALIGIATFFVIVHRTKRDVRQQHLDSIALLVGVVLIWPLVWAGYVIEVLMDTLYDT